MERRAIAIAIMSASAFSASAAYVVLGNLFASAPLLAAGMAIYAYYLRRLAMPEGRLERDTLAFLDNMVKQSAARGLRRRIETALSSNFVFYKGFVGALKEYSLSGDAGIAFARLDNYKGNRYFEIAIVLLRESLQTGIDVSGSLRLLRDECAEHHNIRSRHVGEIANSRMLQLIGGVIFFPVFGGLSLNVLRLSTIPVSMHTYDAVRYAVLLYILIASVMAAAFNRRAMADRIGYVGMRIAAASFVFGFSAAMASTLV